MSIDNCPECGHLLTNEGTECPFCAWHKEDELVSVRMNRNDLELDYYMDDIRPDQLPGF